MVGHALNQFDHAGAQSNRIAVGLSSMAMFRTVVQNAVSDSFVAMFNTVLNKWRQPDHSLHSLEESGVFYSDNSRAGEGLYSEDVP